MKRMRYAFACDTDWTERPTAVEARLDALLDYRVLELGEGSGHVE